MQYQSNRTNNHLQEFLRQSIATARELTRCATEPFVVVSPYRINPLGAHVDHQGGSVLARTIDQFTLLPFWPGQEQADPAQTVVELLTEHPEWKTQKAKFQPGDATSAVNWIRYAQASTHALGAVQSVNRGFKGFVAGSRMGAGLSSSASVVLAYLTALIHVNELKVSSAAMVELCRQVENDYMGLNNGIQDQMSIVYGQRDALSLLDMRSATAAHVNDAANVDEISWVLCYSGFSRELINSKFNTRVKECRQAARALDPNAVILGDVDPERVTSAMLKSLPQHHAGRAQHFFSEVQRVQSGVDHWKTGDWSNFGRLMNESCHSSITGYESGSQPLIDLHEIASSTSGVYGSRFSGGGYGGCLIMLADKNRVDSITDEVLQQYLKRYPEKRDVAQSFAVCAEDGVRIRVPGL